jgi:hypothetical protein
MDSDHSLWLALAYVMFVVGSAIRSCGRTLRLCFIVTFLTAVGIAAWFTIGRLR